MRGGFNLHLEGKQSEKEIGLAEERQIAVSEAGKLSPAPERKRKRKRERERERDRERTVRGLRGVPPRPARGRLSPKKKKKKREREEIGRSLQGELLDPLFSLKIFRHLEGLTSSTTVSRALREALRCSGAETGQSGADHEKEEGNPPRQALCRVHQHRAPAPKPQPRERERGSQSTGSASSNGHETKSAMNKEGVHTNRCVTILSWYFALDELLFAARWSRNPGTQGIWRAT